MPGRAPAWLINASDGHWQSAETRVKTLWVLSKQASGPLHVEGRRLDGEGTARFQGGGVDGARKDPVDIDDWGRRPRPGMATPEVRRAEGAGPPHPIYRR